MADDHVTRDAKVALRTIIAWVQPFIDLEQTVDTLVAEKLDEAEARASALVADATKRAADIDAASAAESNAHKEGMRSDNARKEALTKAVAELDGRHAGLTGKVDALQAHYDGMKAEMAATAAKYAAKT